MATSSISAEMLIGSWLVDTLLGKPVVAHSAPTLTFTADGRLSGNASCNRMMGDYTLEKGCLTLSHIGLTRRLCPPDLMTQEQRLVTMMQDVASAEIHDDMLQLLNDDGGLLCTAQRQPDED